MANVNAHIELGENYHLSTNNILNTFTPFGDGALVRIANMYVNVLQRGSVDKLTEFFKILSSHPAKLSERDDNDIAVGKQADLVAR